MSGSLITLKQIVPTPTPTSSPTSTPTPTPTSSPTSTPTPTPTPTSSPTSTPTPTPTPTSSPTSTPTPTPTSTSTVVSKGEGISTVTLNSTQVSVTSEKGYSGVTNVVVEVKSGAGTTTYTVPVTVNPIEPITPKVSPQDPKISNVSWTPDASAESYVVKVDNKTVCVTTNSSCPVAGLIGPNTDVTVQAQGNDSTSSQVVDAVYANKKPITALVVNFNTNSAKLDAIDKAQIRAVAKTIVEQGFTHVVINGHTDIIGGVDNKALSAARAKATYDYLTQYAPNLDVKLGAFASTKPVAKGSSPDALAANRRAEVGVY